MKRLLVVSLFACLTLSLSARSVVVGLSDACFTNVFSETESPCADAVYAAGAVPYLLPSSENPDMLDTLVGHIDLLLVRGENAKWESALSRAAAKRNLPVLRAPGSLPPEFAQTVRDLERKGLSPSFPPSRMKLVAIPDYCPTNAHVLVKQNMVQALEQANFASVVIPFTTDDAKLREALSAADSMMVAGGIGTLQDYPRRCEFELRAIRIALARGIPIAGVCHGSQVLNVYFGGTLENTAQANGQQDALIRHRMPVTEPYTDNFHLADFVPGSRIARIFGSTRGIINSSHSRRSCKMGKGLRVTARAQDNVVETFEHESLPIMAFQFHPERLTFDRRMLELLRSALSPLGK